MPVVRREVTRSIFGLMGAPCLQLAPEPEEIEANQRAAVLDRMDLLLHARHHRNVHELP